jgi:FKBP-type peptidyl-prolyl cis-trans isomerase FklB
VLIRNPLMKLMIIITVFFCLSGHSYADTNMAIMSDPVAKLQYSLGYQIGTAKELKGYEIDQDALIVGIQDALSGQLQLSEDEIHQVLLNLGEKILASKNTKAEKLRVYKAENLSFLFENQSRSGVITTDSGLQYEILQSGDGSVPGLNNLVDVHYTGRLINGHEFESSLKENEPARFKVDQVIKGWSEALQLMNQGAKWRLYIPADLAYGSEGVEHLIPPDSTLILDVELIAIN